MEKSKKITVEQVSFKQAAPYLQKSLAGNEIPLSLECENGVSQCWRFNKGLAYMLTRVEKKELVVCCFEGSRLKPLIDYLFISAKSCGFTSIRFHTKRPAILKLLNQNFHLIKNTGVEYIYRGFI